jgi:hypothetical protein
MMRKLDAISRWFKNHCMRQSRTLEFSRVKVTHDALDSHDFKVNLRQSFQRSNLDGKVMKANVCAPIKGSGTLLCLPESNHGRSVGQKVAGIRLVPTNPRVSNGFKELEGLLEITDSEANMTYTGGQLGVCRHAWFLLRWAYFFPCLREFVRLIFVWNGAKGEFEELRNGSSRVKVKFEAIRNASSVHQEANIVQAGRSEAIKKDASHITARKGESCLSKKNMFCGTYYYLSTTLMPFGRHIYIQMLVRS